VCDCALFVPPGDDGELDLAVVAEVLALAVSDAELQPDLRRRAEAAPGTAFSRSSATGRDLREAVEAAVTA